jgi:ATP-binding cassette subfamily C (CFTR/MRP) protein 1
MYADYLLPQADSIIIMEDGRIVDRGSYPEIVARHPRLAMQLHNNCDNGLSAPGTDSVSPNIETSPKTPETKILEGEIKEKEEEEQSFRQRGTWNVYSFYFKNAGYSFLAIFVALVIVEVLASNLTSELAIYPDTLIPVE